MRSSSISSTPSTSTPTSSTSTGRGRSSSPATSPTPSCSARENATSSSSPSAIQADSCSMPTRASSPSSAGWGSSMSSRREAGSRWGLAIGLVLVAALVGLLAFLLGRNVGLERAAPPIEELTFERIELPRPGLVRIHVVNGGVDPVTIHQAMIDDAVWSFTIEPDPTIGRLSSATVSIPYPWVEGDTHHLRLVSRNGITFDSEIAVATETPSADARWIGQLALLGLYVGILPVALGLATYPFLKRLGERGIDFLLALTVGLLVFLAID